MSRLIHCVLAAWASLTSCAFAYEPGSQEGTVYSQFTFAWPLGEKSLKPRGATTHGTPVTLDTGPSASWSALHAPGLTDRERDRRAILAMAGQYRVNFDFLEVIRFDPALKPDAPYQSWGTERVLVSENREDFISLQHILVMRLKLDDDKVSEPIVIRHWRQEWQYEAGSMLVYDGVNSWSRRALSADQRKGAWVQSVFQVDDSPRYSGRGRWEHGDSFSSWISDDTWRPLPRREWSVRTDYQVLTGTNRHTITATGWVQEENNLKLALDERNRPRASLPVLAREYGVARYERIRDYDFAAGEDYFAKTEPFWAEVRAAWRQLQDERGRLSLTAPVDKGQLFLPFSRYAQALAEGKPFERAEARAFVDKTLRQDYLLPERP
jgi:hypothetical protein